MGNISFFYLFEDSRRKNCVSEAAEEPFYGSSRTQPVTWGSYVAF
jgi:hypothetical protein